MDVPEPARCFGCHATNAVENDRLTVEKMIPGVHCVHCHTAAAKHLAGLAEGDLDLDEMKKLSAMSTDEVSNFCGQCHRTLTDVLARNQIGIETVRFQPYRLALSKCYDLSDRRISCLACHDPHEELTTEAAHYDAKCLACHGGGKPRARSCKVAKKDCTDCHMPKIELPGGHHKFADHTIRIVKTSETKPAGTR
jgi:Zn finger protein HypA/HybF involved in hydrogenase expression